MKKTIFIIVVSITLLAFVGWIKCIVHFCNCDFKESYKAEIIYGVGICTGTGCVIGYIDLGK